MRYKGVTQQCLIEKQMLVSKKNVTLHVCLLVIAQ